MNVDAVWPCGYFVGWVAVPELGHCVVHMWAWSGPYNEDFTF